ncbi:MAG: MFS transporter [Melioribacteraceae bacterium]|nr:MFS transporter [Melioribacteraceae bacterium]MCF8263822.1 MFS transporter [Melioribacteraceae bacterium]MCF8431060.1 MFS transporter [Melioribacteraceae bacterium]
MVLSVIMYKKMEISNTEIALYTSWLYLPWVIKPFWSPVVDLIKSKRMWVLSTQLIISIAPAGVAFTIPANNFFQITLAFFWLMAFASATHDIAADGFYMLALPEKGQAFFVGIRSTFYRIGMITGQGLLTILAGNLEEYFGDIHKAWSYTIFTASAIYFCVFIYHLFQIPKPEDDKPRENFGKFWADFIFTFKSFFQKKGIVLTLLFLLLYRLSEGQLVKLASPFLLDETSMGGLGLSTANVGLIYGTIGILALVLGGILGGWAISSKGLKYWIWVMLVAINIPNGLYALLAFFQPDSIILISLSVAIEQFGYGFGFTAYMMYMIYISEGEFKTSHFAISTGLMALGMMIPGLFSGWLQELLSYKIFFIWVLISAVPIFIVTYFLKIDENFGKRD